MSKYTENLTRNHRASMPSPTEDRAGHLVRGIDHVAPLTEDHTSEGLTKREYFAAHALAGIIGHCEVSLGPDSTKERHARQAVQYADALLRALSA